MKIKSLFYSILAVFALFYVTIGWADNQCPANNVNFDPTQWLSSDPHPTYKPFYTAQWNGAFVQGIVCVYTYDPMDISQWQTLTYITPVIKDDILKNLNWQVIEDKKTYHCDITPSACWWGHSKK